MPAKLNAAVAENCFYQDVQEGLGTIFAKTASRKSSEAEIKANTPITNLNLNREIRCSLSRKRITASMRYVGR